LYAAARPPGYAVAEAKTIPGSQLLLPQLQQVKDLGLSLVDLAKSYRQVVMKRPRKPPCKWP